MERKTFPALGLKIDADQGIVEHIFAVFGNVDEGGDILHPGSFAKTISERGNKIRVLDQHQTDSIMRAIGKPMALREIGRDELPPEIRERFPEATGGVKAVTRFLLDTPEGKGAFLRIKEGAVDEWSFGYDALDIDYDKVTRNGKEVTVRNLRTIKLYEYSPVLWGMNQATSTLSAKGKEEPTDEKPWDVFKIGDKWHVYRVDEDGKRTGASLGEHDTEEEARQQVEALYANEGKDEPPEDESEKALNLTVTLRSIDQAFDDQFNPVGLDGYRTWHCSIREIFDEYVIASNSQLPEYPYYRVNYHRDERGKYVFASTAEWIGGNYVFIAGVKVDQAPLASKAGRVLAARNASRILAALRQLQDALKDAGVDYDAEENGEDDDEKNRAPDERAAHKQHDGTQAGPPPAPTSDTMLKLIDIELAEIS